MSNNIRFITREGEKSLSPSSSTSSLKGLQLKNPISSSYAEEEDTLQLKQGLNKLGYYEVPPYGMTPYADSAMIDSIKKLQQDANLTVDGKVNPDGETLSEINKRLGQKETSFAKDGETLNKSLNFTHDVLPGLVGYNRAILSAYSNQEKLNQKKGLNDKYKHSYLSCQEAQKGLQGAVTIGALGIGKEAKDLLTRKNNLSESKADLEADIYGIKQGIFNGGDCDELVQRKYKKYR